MTSASSRESCPGTARPMRSGRADAGPRADLPSHHFPAAARPAVSSLCARLTGLRRHWCTAQCSESTGTISAPGVRRGPLHDGPPAISDSLLARARRRPASRAARVTGRPAKPTTPLTTISASLAMAARAPSPARTSVPRGPGPRARGPRSVANGYPRRAELSGLLGQGGDRRPRPQGDDLKLARAGRAARPAPAYRSSPCCQRYKHSWLRSLRVSSLRTSAHEVESDRQEVCGRQHEQQGVEAVQEPTMPGQERARILEAQVPLDHRLDEVT